MPRRLITAAFCATLAILASACGSQGVQVAKSDPNRKGAVLFAERCSGCHTLEAAGTQGSTTDVTDRERTDGPNFDTRKETVEDVLFAIQNGGFSGAIMPENIATGAEAKAIAEFVAEFAGKKSNNQVPTSPGNEGDQGNGLNTETNGASTTPETGAEQTQTSTEPETDPQGESTVPQSNNGTQNATPTP